uniref:Uncharacterized protein n=1 Tax=Romanomermis culicivorax TaxID=13658 RepID=A0A915JUW6_ROMCU
MLICIERSDIFVVKDQSRSVAMKNLQSQITVTEAQFSRLCMLKGFRGGTGTVPPLANVEVDMIIIAIIERQALCLKILLCEQNAHRSMCLWALINDMIR